MIKAHLLMIKAHLLMIKGHLLMIKAHLLMMSPRIRISIATFPTMKSRNRPAPNPARCSTSASIAARP